MAKLGGIPLSESFKGVSDGELPWTFTKSRASCHKVSMIK